MSFVTWYVNAPVHDCGQNREAVSDCLLAWFNLHVAEALALGLIARLKSKYRRTRRVTSMSIFL